MKKYDKKLFILRNVHSKIFRNFRTKFICFLLAIALYFSVAFFMQRSTKTYTTNLKISNLRDHLVISNNMPEKVRIIARDKPRVFNKITENDFNVRLDLAHIRGPNKYNEKLEWDIPEDMKSFFSTIKVIPNEIEINVEELTEKTVKIVINKIGRPAPGYIEKRTTVDPPSIRIQGPKSQVKQIDKIKTEPINIEGVKDSFRRHVDLISDNPMIKSLGKADIYFEIVEETDIVAYKYTRVYFQNLKQQFKASIKRNIFIKLKGPKHEIQNITQADISLIVDCANIAYPGDYTNDIIVKKPAFLTIVSLTPERVNFTVEDR